MCQYLQIAGKPYDNYRISPQSVNITGFPHNRESCKDPVIPCKHLQCGYWKPTRRGTYETPLCRCKSKNIVHCWWEKLSSTHFSFWWQKLKYSPTHFSFRARTNRKYLHNTHTASATSVLEFWGQGSTRVKFVIRKSVVDNCICFDLILTDFETNIWICFNKYIINNQKEWKTFLSIHCL